MGLVRRVVIAGILTFVPVYFLHPVRVIRLRDSISAIFLAWCAFGALALVQTMDASYFVKVGIAVTGIYLFASAASCSFSRHSGDERPDHVQSHHIHAHGGPEALRYEDIDPGRPGEGQVLIRHTAIGLNFLDVYYRIGLYAAPNGLPLIPGGEAAGVVVELGEGVAGLKQGDRVAYAMRSAPIASNA